jgi:hypothetical protein
MFSRIKLLRRARKWLIVIIILASLVGTAFQLPVKLQLDRDAVNSIVESLFGTILEEDELDQEDE